ncbi:MAG: metallophosphoesterase family protein [Chloroflexi bacterium]|nr:metallophosphoesterase family protein [Chloroflexota bacterium]
MIKLAIFTDVHGNLPALRAALQAIKHEGVDAMIHLGDAISIGPFSAECLDLLLSQSNIHFIMGNHDAWYANGLPQPQPKWMSNGEVMHQTWTHRQINPSLRQVVAKWPYVMQETFEKVSFTCLHYALQPAGNDFLPIVQNPSTADLDHLFETSQTDLIFYGHTHRFADAQGKARYINPGSLGCYTEPVARYTAVTCHQGSYTIDHCAIPYDDQPLFAAFENRQVPEKEFLYEAFFGDRFHS